MHQNHLQSEGRPKMTAPLQINPNQGDINSVVVLYSGLIISANFVEFVTELAIPDVMRITLFE
jgi:hypothetical protein